MKIVSGLLLSVILAVAFTVGAQAADDKIITMSTTTSTESSGLLDYLLPILEKDTGIKIKVVAKGTGAAIRDGMDGNVDVVFVHALDREEKFVAEGYGAQRYAVMHNDFIILGPASDPAGVKGMTDAAAAMKKIAAAGSPFVSRGDDSGTHTKEQELWAATGLALKEDVSKIKLNDKDVEVKSKRPEGDWYLSIGQGMGKTLTFSDEKQAYTLADRGTFVSYKYAKTPAVELDVLVEGDPLLFNPYGVIPVDPKKFPHVKFDLAKQFAEWLVSEKGQSAIAQFQLEGKRLFFPDAIPDAK